MFLRNLLVSFLVNFWQHIFAVCVKNDILISLEGKKKKNWYLFMGKNFAFPAIVVQGTKNI